MKMSHIMRLVDIVLQADRALQDAMSEGARTDTAQAMYRQSRERLMDELESLDNTIWTLQQDVQRLQREAYR